LTKSKKRHPSTKKDATDETLVQKKPTASRHLLLIRHGQFNVDGEIDEKRTLTPLGCYSSYKGIIVIINTFIKLRII